MEYTISFTNGKRFIAIALIGMAILIASPIYLRIQFGLNETIMVILCFSGLALPWVIGYFASKQKETFLLNEDGLFNKKFGFIKWQEVESIGLIDNTETEVFTIKLQSGNKITIPSYINESSNRQTFVNFKNEVQNRFAHSRNSPQNITQYPYAFEGKEYRLFGYTLIFIVILFTCYIFYLGFTGEISGKELAASTIVYGSALPMIVRIFRKELFGK